MAKLHELLAVANDSKNTAVAISEETKTTFSKRPDHFRGFTKTVEYFDEDRSAENTHENKEMVTTVHEKLNHFFSTVGDYYDVLLQMEFANCEARADLKVDGVVIMKDVPAQFLLSMETRMKDVRNVLLSIPTLEMGVRWTEDKVSGEGVYIAEDQISMKSEKVLKSRILVEPTPHHPAQVEKWTEDSAVAKIIGRVRSGMITPHEKSQILRRCDKLISEIKKSRQRANCVEVTNVQIADAMFSYVLGS